MLMNSETSLVKSLCAPEFPSKSTGNSMARAKENPEIKHRIEDEVVVDCYGEFERLRPRLESIVEEVNGIGWGHYDELPRIFCETFPKTP